MTFHKFLQAIKHQLPASSLNDSFIALFNKYMPLSFSHVTQSTTIETIILSDQEISCLIDILTKHKIHILEDGIKASAFMRFINMGTLTDSELTNADPLLGQKDPRIEQAIINAAIRKKRQLGSIENQAPAKQIAIFGLSGNPPTLNHFYMIKHLTENTEYDMVVPMLNAQSPLKAIEGYVDAKHRFLMLKNMLEAPGVDPTKYHLSRLEIDRAAPSRMIVTLSAMTLLSNQYQKLSLILGRDALALNKGKPNFTYWYQWQEFAQLCELKIYPREGAELSITEMAQAITTLQTAQIHLSIIFRDETTKNSYIEQLTNQLDDLSSYVRFDVEDVNTTKGSATDIRNHYKANLPGVPNGLALINDAYIRSHQLFSFST